MACHLVPLISPLLFAQVKLYVIAKTFYVKRTYPCWYELSDSYSVNMLGKKHGLIKMCGHASTCIVSNVDLCTRKSSAFLLRDFHGLKQHLVKVSIRHNNTKKKLTVAKERVSF